MTLLKQFIVTGMVLSLICVVTVAEAVAINVTTNSDLLIPEPGSLRDAVNRIHEPFSPYDEITFDPGLDINLISTLPTFRTPVKITGEPNLKIRQGDDEPTNTIFDVAAGVELHLVERGVGVNSNWQGSISGPAGATIRFEQQASSTYPGTISGDVSIICQGVGQTLTLGNTNTYTGGTSIPSGILAVGINNALPTDGIVNTTGGTLAIENGFTQTLAGVTGSGSITNAGTLKIDSAADSTFGGPMSGTGNFIKKGTGAVELTNQSTYTGTTEILQGTLKSNALLNNALPPTNTVTVSSNAILEIVNNRAQTLQSIAGDGRVNIDNAATLTAATIADGSFAGDITAAGTGAFVKSGTNTLTLSGSHPNTGNLQIVGGGIKMPTGGSWDGPVTIGAATLEMNGGTVTQAITGNGLRTSILNITKDFTPAVAITDIGSVNVRSGGTLFLTKDIAGATGSVVNEGAITHTASETRTIPENFTQEATGTINIGITSAGAGQYSQFQVNGNTTLRGGIMNVQLLPGAQITNGTVFDIITSTRGIEVGAVLPTIPKASLFFGFKPVVTGNKLQLIATRSGCTCINTIPALNGIAKGIDNLAENDTFNALLGILNEQASQKAFENKLEQLAPTGLNGIHTTAAQAPGGAEQILLRLDSIRTGTGGLLARAGYASTGYAAGDVMEDRGSYGPIIFGNSIKQSMREGLSGYNAATSGFGFLGDAPILEYFRVGLGASHANSVVRQSNNTGSHITIGSTQGMAYGSATYGHLFLDAVLSAGINNYKGKRNVSFIGPTATSRYNGFQYGAKVKAGFAIPCHRIEISPMAAVQYMHLNVGQYTEQGAGTLNQHLSSMQTSTVRVNLGGRVSERSQEGTFFPEIHAFYITDVKNPQVIITSRFVEGGGSFASTSVVPPKHGVNLGASVTALISNNFTLSGGYDLEAKKSFKSHSASFKFKFLF